MLEIKKRGRPYRYSVDEIHAYAWKSGTVNGHPDSRIVPVNVLAEDIGMSEMSTSANLERLKEEGRARKLSLGKWEIFQPGAVDGIPDKDFKELFDHYKSRWPLLGMEKLVGISPKMEEVRNLIRIAAGGKASSDTLIPILITGESGTGKELVAQLVHESSPRSDNKFIPINCAAVPTELLESELFGHEKGSFTGAITRRQGWFDHADRGTIFLDEIGESEPAFQRKVLRVLENGQFIRLGGSEVLQTRARVIAATNRDLKEEIKEKRFRVDLFYRLDVFPIYLPTLAERKEDIMHIFAFLAVERENTTGIRHHITPKALGMLEDHDWAGNVRELRNVAMRAFILSDDGLIRSEHIRF
jgi:Nif-specific regulatory protein